MYKGREGEKALIASYGLKNAKELWKAKSEVARIRALARKLLARPDEKMAEDILNRLKKTGMLKKDSKLEDVLGLTVESALDRRLQTQVYKKGLTHTIKQARQAIVHGHVSVNGGRMTAPGHLTTLQESESIEYYAGSPMKDPEHPVRKVEKKASSEDRVKAEDVKPPSEREARKKEAEEKKSENKESEEKGSSEKEGEKPEKDESKKPEKKDEKGSEKEGDESSEGENKDK